MLVSIFETFDVENWSILETKPMWKCALTLERFLDKINFDRKHQIGVFLEINHELQPRNTLHFTCKFRRLEIKLFSRMGKSFFALFWEEYLNQLFSVSVSPRVLPSFSPSWTHLVWKFSNYSGTCVYFRSIKGMGLSGKVFREELIAEKNNNRRTNTLQIISFL
jgi:hypothetical protein